jgi:DNA-binding transcriptional LysR family regulator
VDIHQLRIFVSVYKNRSFSKASEEIHLSQPTVSEHIKKLEEELGCELFERLGRTIIPTKEAEVLLPGAISILESMERLKEDLSLIKGKIKGPLVVGASTIPGTYILPAICSEFKRYNPEISFEIIIEDSGKITDMVVNHELIIGVVGARMDMERISYTPIVEDELILVASGDLLEEDQISINGLYRIPFILREKGSGTRKTMEEFLRRKGCDISECNVVAVLGSTASVKEALRSGLGVSIISRIAVEDELRRGVLKEIRISGVRMRRNFFLIRLKKRSLSSPYGAFCDFLINKLKMPGAES